MDAAYPIHPELFDRLYQDWSTLERFQRTRGVLRLMASVISELWDRNDTSLMIMPGVLPMASAKVVPELTRYLPDQWKPIIDADVEGTGSLPERIDRDRNNLGAYSACHRVARTTYLGSAPLPRDRRGIDRTRIVLGCVQPGEKPGVFGDALRHLAADATYLYNQQKRYWYDTKVSLAKTAADRALSNFDEHDADLEIGRRIQRLRPANPLGGVHVFPDGPGDVPDEDDAVRLVILPPTRHYERGGGSPAIEAARAILEQRRGGSRISRNMVVFLAAAKERVPELRQAIRSRLAWQSILDEKGEHQLNLTPSDVSQVTTRLKEADQTVGLRIGETFCQVLYPVQPPGESKVRWSNVRVSGGAGLSERVVRKLESSEHLISTYSGIRIRRDLDRKDAPLWNGDHVGIRDLWSYYCRYLYMPRLAGFGALSAAISRGVADLNWQSDTFACAESYDPEADRYPGLKAGEQVEITTSYAAVLVRSGRAAAQLHTESRSAETEAEVPAHVGEAGKLSVAVPPGAGRHSVEAPLPTRFYGRMDLDPVRAIRDLSSILDEVTTHLTRAGGNVTITVEVNAQSDGFDSRTQRIVKENATQLGFKAHEFEA